MSIHVALHHKTTYSYPRSIELGPQVIRLRPAPHCRTPILGYSMRVKPDDNYVNWQQDPFGNYLGRCVFHTKATEFSVEIDVVASLSSINPFDFFMEPDAELFPFSYEAETLDDLKPYLALKPAGPRLHALLGSIDQSKRKTIDFLVDLNQRLEKEIDYCVRLEPGVQTPEETLEKRKGSCRDSAWLFCQILRHLGFASRFVSGYLIQLTSDQKSLDGPSGPESDFTDLHAWTEVFLPGAGWVGLDPTSGLFAGEGHIPLACTPAPTSAAPISGAHEPCEVEFDFEMSVQRVHEDPRVTKPYTEEQWQRIEALGNVVDEHLHQNDVRLTMGGEPTFVSIDDMDGDEWQSSAVGPTKRRFGYDLLTKLKKRFGDGSLVHFGQGKWYPGESLPRWAMQCFWRKDGEPVWKNDALFARDGVSYGHTADDALRFGQDLANRLQMDTKHVISAYEDTMYYAWRERRLPANVNPLDSKLEDAEERERLAKIFEQGLTSPVGVVLPIQYRWWDAQPRWHSGEWVVRADQMFLTPGDSPMGYRLPLVGLLYGSEANAKATFFEADPMAASTTLPMYEALRNRQGPGVSQPAFSGDGSQSNYLMQRQGNGPSNKGLSNNGTSNGADFDGLSDDSLGPNGQTQDQSNGSEANNLFKVDVDYNDPKQVLRTALCIEPRNGALHIFMPPTDRLEVYLELVTAIEETAESLNMPIVMEGYLPPTDLRLQNIKVTPDPGVLEVNVQPAENWNELVNITTGVYEDARQTRLGTEKYDTDGAHTGTGGGNHVVLGGITAADSPWLRRPDLLKSFIAFWQNHPSLSYLFSGKFIGPTSQAPRVEESRVDAMYELKIAFEQIQQGKDCPPWMVDRVFRNLLVDGTGNTHRAEFCIDKLFSPDSSTGRLGLLEFRAFEMPPHARMSLTQQLLIRALVAKFWEKPYTAPIVSWGTTLHDRWMLPHFIWQDFEDVISQVNESGFAMEQEWFDSQWEFRFPVIGKFSQRGVSVELRRALEPWYVLGEEQASGGMSRYVDSSVERLEVKVNGMTDPRHIISCNGRRLPLHPTGNEGEFVAGVRYRAWQPPSCLHPTIPVDDPVTIDLLDTWLNRSLGGCQYYVGHPGGLNPSSFPVNALEAESRRATRFFGFGHTPGEVKIPEVENNPEFPLTLDLRRGKH